MNALSSRSWVYCGLISGLEVQDQGLHGWGLRMGSTRTANSLPFPLPICPTKGCYFHQPGIVCVSDTPKEKDLGELSLYRAGSAKSCEAESYN